jgi:hypothetical protein
METTILTYDAARLAISACASLDDAKVIRDKSAALRHYHLQIKDPERAEWLGQIACRAVIRIGELSSQLEKAEVHGGKIRLPINGQSKQQVLAEAEGALTVPKING